MVFLQVIASDNDDKKIRGDSAQDGKLRGQRRAVVWDFGPSRKQENAAEVGFDPTEERTQEGTKPSLESWYLEQTNKTKFLSLRPSLWTMAGGPWETAELAATRI